VEKFLHSESLTKLSPVNEKSVFQYAWLSYSEHVTTQTTADQKLSSVQCESKGPCLRPSRWPDPNFKLRGRRTASLKRLLYSIFLSCSSCWGRVFLETFTLWPDRPIQTDSRGVQVLEWLLRWNRFVTRPGSPPPPYPPPPPHPLPHFLQHDPSPKSHLARGWF